MKVTDAMVKAALRVWHGQFDISGRTNLIAIAMRAALEAAERERVAQEPVGWLESPHGDFRANPAFRLDAVPQTVRWSIPVYLPPTEPESAP